MSTLREAPKDIEAERLVLASMMLDAKAIHIALDGLTAKDFFAEHHRIIFGVIHSLHQDSIAVDHNTVRAELQRRDLLKKIGGILELAKITDGIPITMNVQHYCSIVREKSVLRHLMQLSYELHEQAAKQELRPQELLESAQSRLIALYGRYQTGGLRSIAEVAHEGFAELEVRKSNPSGFGLPTGFVDIDALLGGMRPGNMIVLAARPGCGKTSLAVSIGINVAKTGKRVAIFSLEMGNSELYCRIIATEAKLGVSGLLSGRFPREQWRQITEVSEQLSRYPVLLDDSGSIDMMQLAARCRRAKSEAGLDLVIIDYMQLIKGPGKSPYERVSNISREIKLLAKDLKVPVIVLSQLHRLQSETTEPQLSDLRESGAIEQDADTVMFLWFAGNPMLRNCKVAKQRNGPTGQLELGFDAEQTRFYSVYRG